MSQSQPGPIIRAAGAELLDLHLNYEGAEPYPLAIASDSVGQAKPYDYYRVQKLGYLRRQTAQTEVTTILDNDHITVSGIPGTAQRDVLGSRSGVDWAVDRYRVTTVSVRTVEVVEGLPGLAMVESRW